MRSQSGYTVIVGIVVAAALAIVILVGYQVVQTNQIGPVGGIASGSNVQSGEQAEVTDTVLAVYKHYYQLSTQAGGSAAAKDYIRKSGEVTTQLVAQVNAQTDTDPLLCSQTASDKSPSAERAALNGSKASVLVHSGQVSMRVDLVKDGQWKLDQVTCL